MARLRASWRTSLPVVQQPRNPQSESIARTPYDFYIPKPSGRAQLLEAKADVDRRLALIPLTDGERAAVEQDQQAVGRLLEGLANTPTPAGPTPRELAVRPSLSPCQPYST